MAAFCGVYRVVYRNVVLSRDRCTKYNLYSKMTIFRSE